MQSVHDERASHPGTLGAAARWLLIIAFGLLLFVVRRFGGIAPAPPVSIPHIDKSEQKYTMPNSPPQPTVLKAEDPESNTEDFPVPPDRTTVVPIPDLQR